jgi:hypothetical protein
VLLKAKKVEKEAMKAKEKGIERTHKAFPLTPYVMCS